jgi:hypothetical protein
MCGSHAGQTLATAQAGAMEGKATLYQMQSTLASLQAMASSFSTYVIFDHSIIGTISRKVSNELTQANSLTSI